MAQGAPVIASMPVKRCATCARFREYEADDSYCLACGHESLEAACTCGRDFGYALGEPGTALHCPRCGRALRGRSAEFAD